MFTIKSVNCCQSFGQQPGAVVSVNIINILGGIPVDGLQNQIIIRNLQAGGIQNSKHFFLNITFVSTKNCSGFIRHCLFSVSL